METFLKEKQLKMKKIQSIRMKLEKKKLNPDYADITESLSEELVEQAAEK